MNCQMSDIKLSKVLWTRRVLLKTDLQLTLGIQTFGFRQFFGTKIYKCMKKWICICSLFLWAMTGGAQRFLPRMNVTDLDGNRFETQDVLNDSVPVILAFWSTTCKPCVQELDALSEVWEEWQKILVCKLVAVSVDDSRTMPKVRPMVNGREWPFLVWLDENQDLMRAMNVNTIPALFVLDKSGRIVYSHVGYIPGAENEVLKILKKLKS